MVFRAMFSKSLYRRTTFQASLALLLGAAVCALAGAQRHKPHKLRATSLVELSTDSRGASSARVIPIAILDEGSFQDASIYKSTPRPMALDDGVVYEAQRSGQVVGYVTLGRAVKGKDGAWSAPGRWQLPSAPKPAATPSAIADEGGGRPVLHRSGSSGSTSTPATTASPSPSPSPSPAASPSATPTPAAAEPIPDDPNRPVLRRGKPEAVQPPPPSAQASAKAVSSPGPPGAPAQKLTLSQGTQTLVGVSDTESSDVRSYEFIWKKGEQAEMEAKMRRLAVAQLPRQNPPLSEHSLAKVAIRSFDLDLSNDAVMVLTAEIPPSATAGAKGTTAPAVTRYLTLIARVDFEGTPQKLAVSLTDSSRLDVAPRLELIDAVDADGDGVADLLFRQYSFDSKSYVIYGIGRGTVTKMFEGASSPLK
jgi:hypothetical protein